jgi:hypothetical protein
MFDFEKGKIRFIRGGKYPQSNSVLIDDDMRTIIDPACNEEKLLSIHRERPIDVIINSHGHEDHILYNSRFPDAQLWVHELDAHVFKDMDVYLVSHGKEGIMEGDPAHIQRYIQVIYQRDEKLLAFLASGPKTIQEITAHGIIYGGHRLANGAWDLSKSEKSMMQKHLERLERIGSVKKENGAYNLV